MTQVKLAKHYVEHALSLFASTYQNTGCEWEEACDHAEFLFKKFKSEGNDDKTAADRLYFESHRYEDM